MDFKIKIWFKISWVVIFLNLFSDLFLHGTIVLIFIWWVVLSRRPTKWRVKARSGSRSPPTPAVPASTPPPTGTWPWRWPSRTIRCRSASFPPGWRALATGTTWHPRCVLSLAHPKPPWNSTVSMPRPRRRTAPRNFCWTRPVSVAICPTGRPSPRFALWLLSCGDGEWNGGIVLPLFFLGVIVHGKNFWIANHEWRKWWWKHYFVVFYCTVGVKCNNFPLSCSLSSILVRVGMRVWIGANGVIKWSSSSKVSSVG